MRYGDDRTPLEMTPINSKSNILVICPHCFSGRYVSRNWLGSVCGKCKKYFNKDEAIEDVEQLEGLVSDKTLINKEFIKIKANMEKKAYEWKEEQIQKKKAGTLLTHEPRGL